MTKIDGDGITLTTFAGGGIAEIVIDPAAKPPISAAELVRFMLEHGVTAAKIIRTTQTEEESPLSAVCDPTGERAKQPQT